MTKKKRAGGWIGALCLGIGMVAVSAGFAPVPPKIVRAPRWTVVGSEGCILTVEEEQSHDELVTDVCRWLPWSAAREIAQVGVVLSLRGRDLAEEERRRRIISALQDTLTARQTARRRAGPPM
ncbi:MAG: hypothetical protein HYV63_05900 [Candidatus Schekmanbacteria bacterium]|nr:hypothetical protein [Candidatus Schekmanbacteria bacterium]